jgi:hypothetical protein
MYLQIYQSLEVLSKAKANHARLQNRER